ncbi:MAG: hypothetical protein Q9195_008727 [Heterodermia aff. obscurata]
MAMPIQVFYFGDQSMEPYDSVADLLRETQASIALPEFLCSAFDTLQSAISALLPAEQSLFTGRDFGQILEYVRVNEIRHTAVSYRFDSVLKFHTEAYSLKNPAILASSLSMTLSGPPSFLQDFLSSEPIRLARKLPLPIYGPFHAPHLQLLHVDAIIGESEFFERPVEKYQSLLRPNLQVDSSAPSLRQLLVRAVGDILQVPLDIDDDFRQVLERVQVRKMQLTSIGPARMSHLERALNPVDVHQLGSPKLQLRNNSAHATDHRNSIAVVGMAGRFADAQNVDELWKVLIDNKDLHRMIPIDRFDVRTHVDPTGQIKNTSLTPYGCFDEHVGEFDISLFKMSPKEATQTDPLQRMMLLTAYEALESAGYYDNGDQDVRPRNGTFYGVGADDYRQVNSSQDVDINYVTGGIRAFGPGRVSYYFGWEGPSMVVDTACSASAVAIYQAISSLRLKECDIALAGGANLLTCSDLFAGLSRAKFVSSTGPCKTFDESADGYCRADASATVVLKRSRDSIRDKDNILGVIHSIETHHSGTAISLTHPEADTQSALFESVLRSAGMSIDYVDHIELHGTGTQAGDLAEASSVLRLLKEPRPRDRPLTVSSVKPNVGHSEAASGVTSLIKGLLMLQQKIIPRHIGIKTRFNPKLPPLGDFNVVIPSINMPYNAVSTDSKRRMLVNNFNATGGITAMLLEEYCPATAIGKDVRQHHPITFSAASEIALAHSRIRLLKHLKANTNIEISNLSYTLTARRLHHNFRFACTAGSTKDLMDKLQTELSALSCASKPGTSVFGVFVFTGQASSYSGMAKILFETNSAFRSHVHRSDAACQDMGLPSFVEVIAGDEAHYSKYSQTQSQLALVALEIALAYLLESWGIRPKAVIGHSLGEYSALCVSKVLSLADTLHLVGKRGLLLESACEHNEYSMAAVALSPLELEKTLQAFRFSECEIACLNAPDQTVVSGPDTVIEPLIAQFKANGARVTKLRIPYAFHSKQMDAISLDFQKIAQSIPFKKPSVPLASTLLGEVVEEEGILNTEYLVRQTRETVRFQDALHKLEGLLEDGQTPLWMEVGPGPACLPMIASTFGAKATNLVCALDPRKPNWLTISDLTTKYYSSGGHVRWDEYHKEYLHALSLLQLPSYPFDLKKYWIQYDGDWAIQKNQKASIRSKAARPATPVLESSTLHRLDNDTVHQGTRKLVFTSKLSNEEPESIYIDMALAATSYLYETSDRGSESPAMEVSTLVMSSDLSRFVPQNVELIAKQCPSDTDVVEISVTSLDHGNVELLRCKVVTSDGKDWVADANNHAYLYQSRMDLLGLFLANGHTLKLAPSEVYQNSSSLPNFEDKFQGIQEILLNLESLEAVAKIILPPSKEIYICDPHWLDNFTRVPSLVVNHGRTADNHFSCRGWSSLHILLRLESGTIYRAHVRMQPCGQGNSMIGDLHILDEGGRAAVVIKSIQFKPVVSSKVEIVPQSTGSSTRNKLPNGAADHIGASDSPTPNFPRDNGTIANGFEASNHSEANEVGHDALTVNHSTTLPVQKLANGIRASTEKRSDETPQLINAVLPKPAAEQPHDEEVLLGGSDRPVEFDKVLAVVGDEIGLEPDSLTDNILLEDLGIDSIIQISLIARLEEHLAKPLPQGFFVEFNSIAKLRRYFCGSSE